MLSCKSIDAVYLTKLLCTETKSYNVRFNEIKFVNISAEMWTENQKDVICQKFGE